MQSLLNNWQALTAAAVALGLINFGGPLLSMLGNIKLPSISTAKPASTAIPTRREVLDDLDGAFAYFEAIGCQEGIAAIQTAVTHAYMKHPAPEAKA